MISLTFIPLQERHFPFLLKWLEMPHVKAWWDKDVKWNIDLIKKVCFLRAWLQNGGWSKKIDTGLYHLC